jgi:hypothetical protein
MSYIGKAGGHRNGRTMARSAVSCRSQNIERLAIDSRETRRSSSSRETPEQGPQPLAVVRDRRNVMNQFVVGVAILGLLGSGVLMGCEQGPAEKVGEKLDNALDKLSGKGPLEKAGERIDQAVDTLKKK